MKDFNVTGMSCAACSARVEKAVMSVEGVEKCSVNLLTNSMKVEGTAKDTEIIKAVVDAGYGAEIKSDLVVKESPEILVDNSSKILLKRFLISVSFLILLMYISMGHNMWNWPLPERLAENYIAQGLIQLILAAIIIVINNRFFINGFKGLIKKSPNMDTLVSIGSISAFMYSTYALFAMTFAVMDGEYVTAHHYIHEFYFESSAMILTLITLGKFLEARAKGKTTDALKGLIELSPKTATIVVNEKEKIVSAKDVKIGDIFIIRPGETIPVDGVVLEGQSAVNESNLTGESIPLDKFVGDNISAATINQSGYLKCKATAVGKDTTISKIIQMVSDASAMKAPIAKVADKVSGVFVPIVISIAVITLIVWLLLDKNFGFALARSVSVLVISCPCALGLATPVAIMVGNGIGAKNGILFKTATSLELAGKTKKIVLDKTGTITEGKPKVTDVLTFEETDESKLLTISASLENLSEHPLAKAVVDYAKKNKIIFEKVDDFFAAAGKGVFGKIKGKDAFGGNYNYITQNCEIPKEIKAKAENLEKQGKTPLYFSFDNKFLGIIAVADTVKSDSKKACEELKKLGTEIIMLTGDNQNTATAVAKTVGIERVIAGVLPDEKANVIKSIKATDTVTMVGDGINDAPALAIADVGIALGTGTDIAIDSADVVIMKSSLIDIASAIRLSKATLRTIRQNLFWAFIYNLIGIPLAAGVFITAFGWELNPMFGAAAMSFSSFSVIMNALRLRFKKIRSEDSKNKEKSKMEIVLKIEGMMCPHCEAHVKKALEAVNGVKNVVANHKTNSAVIELEGEVDVNLLKEIVQEAGYTVVE